MDYFTDGLTDEVIRSLSVIEGLTVRAGTSSFALKGKGLNAVEAGAQLDADYLVEGAVLQAGDQLRVNVALVEAREGARVWSNRYDRKLTDVFAIQDEISRGVVTTLQLRVSGRRRYEANLEAYDLYLRGRQIMAAFPSGRGRSVAMPAVEFFQSAIEKDPNYAIAYAGMADAFIAVERNMGASNTVDAWPRAKAAAASALERDPMLSEAHAAMAAIRAREYGWQDAERAFRRAIELNPNNALAHLELGVRVLAIQARIDEGLAEVRRAVALDPLSPYVNTEAGESLILAGRYDEAVARFRKAIDLDPNRPRPYHLLARVLCLQGNAAAAQDAIDQSFKRGAVAIPWLACVAFKTGRREQALALLDQVRSSDSSYRMAWIYACLGDEQALSALEQVSAQNGPRLPELLRSPEFAFLRSNPRFAALLTKVNLER
jgi:TolB-like protein/Tfp pilus assembly protein PilF